MGEAVDVGAHGGERVHDSRAKLAEEFARLQDASGATSYALAENYPYDMWGITPFQGLRNRTREALFRVVQTGAQVHFREAMEAKGQRPGRMRQIPTFRERAIYPHFVKGQWRKPEDLIGERRARNLVNDAWKMLVKEGLCDS